MVSEAWRHHAERCRACTACPDLVASRTQVVVGEAPAGARLAVVGEAPGATEDATGRPFTGRSGALLDLLLDQAGLPRATVAVLNVVRCRPPGNRRPSTAEALRCRSWLEEQLALVAPVLVVTLGATAAAAFLGLPLPTLAAVRGRIHPVGGLRVLPTYHPAAALRGGPAGQLRAALAADLAAAGRVAAAAVPAGPA